MVFQITLRLSKTTQGYVPPSGTDANNNGSRRMHMKVNGNLGLFPIDTDGIVYQTTWIDDIVTMIMCPDNI